jgi:L-fuconolactonase
MESSIQVDAHHHVWDLAARDQPWTADFPALHRSFSIDDLTPLLRRSNVHSTLIVQTLNVAEETPELLALAKECDAVAGVVGWVDLTREEVRQDLDRLRAMTGGEYLVGIRHVALLEEDENWLCLPSVLEGLGAVEESGLTYDLLIRHQQIPAAIEAVKSRLGLKFVLNHIGNPGIGTREIEPWRSQLQQLARYENVAVKLSGLVTSANHSQANPSRWRVKDFEPFVDVVLSAFGAERVMFGSDWPVCLISATYAEVVGVASQLTANLSSAERDLIFGQTAKAWYSLRDKKL